MADVIKPQERMVGQPSAPDLSSAGQVYGGINQVIQTASKMIVGYDKAERQLESSYVFSEYSNALNTAYQDALQPGNLMNTEGGTAFERYQMSAAQMMNEALEQTPAGFQDEMRQKLSSVVDNNTLRVRGAYQDDLLRRNRADIEAKLNESVLNMSDSIRNNDGMGFAQSKLEALSLADSAMNSGMMSSLDVAKFDLKLKEAEIQAQYFKAGEEAAKNSPATVARMQQMLAEGSDELLPHEMDDAIQAFNAGANRAAGLLEGARQRERDSMLANAEQLAQELDDARTFGEPEDVIQEKTKRYNDALKALRDFEYVSETESVSAKHGQERANRLERNRREVENIQAEIAKKEVAHAQFAKGGSQEKADAVADEIRELNKRLVSLRAMSKKEEFDASLGITRESITNRYFQRGVNDQNAPPGTTEKQLDEFATTFYEDDLTLADQKLAIQSYLEGANFAATLKQQNQSIEMAELSNAIARGIVTTPAQILDYDLTALQQKQAEGALIKQQAKSAKGEAKLAQSMAKISAGGGLQDTIGKEDKTAVYSAMADDLRQKRVNETGDQNYQLSGEEAVSILKEMNTDVPWVTARINYAINNADPSKEYQSIESSLALFRELAQTAPNTLRGVDETTRNIANMANSAIMNGQNVNIENAISQARAAAKPETPEEKARAMRWSSVPENDKQKSFKDMFGVEATNSPDAYGEFLNQMSLNTQIADTLDVANESTNQTMTPLYGRDKYFGNESVGYLPSSAAVPYSQIGKWYDNQIYLSLYALTKRQEASNEIDINEKLEWIYGDIPENLSQEKMMNVDLRQRAAQASGKLSFNSGSLRARYKGKDIDVYYKADSTTRMGDTMSYTFYTKDPATGEKRFIPDPRNKNGTGYWSEKIIPFEKFLPDVAEKMTNDKMQKRAESTYRSELKLPFSTIMKASRSKDFAMNLAKEKKKKVEDYKKILLDRENNVVGESDEEL